MIGRWASGRKGSLARARGWIGRCVASDGYERRTLLIIGKSTLAAALAWFVAHYLMDAVSPAFAPFSAVLIMQITVYQSLSQSLRYVGAVALGIAVQALLGFTVGPDMVTFIVVTFIALAIGRWRPLGAQGPQVATAAFFAFSTFITSQSYVERLVDLSQILLLVVLGCAIGTAVNFLVFPPMRFRSAEYAIRVLADTERALLDDIARGLSEPAELTEEDTRAWRSRVGLLDSMVREARAALETAGESRYFNPSRMRRKHRDHTSFEGYQQLVNSLERAAYQLGSLSRSVHVWIKEENHSTYGGFLSSYGEFIASISAITGVLGNLDEGRLTRQADELCRLVERAQSCHSTLARTQGMHDSPPFDDFSQPYGVLLLEARRLLDEFTYSCDVLSYYCGSSGRTDSH